MKAVKNRHCNAELTGDGCKPLPVRRMEYRTVGGNPDARPLVVFSTWWELTEEEMHALARQALEGRPTIRLDVFADQHPPVTMLADNLTPEEIDAMDERENRACRICGCTDAAACVDERGDTCYWMAPGLCSACGDKMSPDEIEALEAAKGKALPPELEAKAWPGAVKPPAEGWPRASE